MASELVYVCVCYNDPSLFWITFGQFWTCPNGLVKKMSSFQRQFCIQLYVCSWDSRNCPHRGGILNWVPFVKGFHWRFLESSCQTELSLRLLQCWSLCYSDWGCVSYERSSQEYVCVYGGMQICDSKEELYASMHWLGRFLLTLWPRWWYVCVFEEALVPMETLLGFSSVCLPAWPLTHLVKG